MTDEDIDYSDILPIGDWSDAVHGRTYRPVKQQITHRLDADVIATSGKNARILGHPRPFERPARRQ